MRPNLIARLKEEWNNLDPVDPLRGLIADAIDALAEQPALYATTIGEDHMAENGFEGKRAEQPAQPSKPLTDEEIVTLFNNTLNGKPLDVNSMTNFARAIEAKLREKNT